MDFQLHEEHFLKDLKALLRIKSVHNDCGAVSSAAQLGQGIYDAIEYMLALGKSYGFRTKNVDGYCGWIEMGEGEKMAAILAHLDTVAVDEGWTYPPFDATVVDGRVYGRGVSDDKGPALLALYAMKAVSESGVKLDKRVRLILGGDEENEWRCMRRYRETEELPSCAFTPDADYPVTFAEKGILALRIAASFGPEIPVLELNGGHTLNVVPSYAEAIVNGTRYTAQGKASHAMCPERGVNAFLELCKKLRDKGVAHPFVRLAAILNNDDLHINFSDTSSGSLTINPSIARADAKGAYVDCDLRVPVTVEKQTVVDAIAGSVKPFGFSVEVLAWEGPLHVAKDSPLVLALQRVYRQCTGSCQEPVSTGGGTYARAFPNAVAFGAMLPDDEHTYHKNDECWKLDSIHKNFLIMANAILEI